MEVAIEANLKDKISIFPEQPGVYLMRDSTGKVIYVGKAINLKKRVKSYFSGTIVDNKTIYLVKQIADIDYIITNDESEAFIAEAAIIKKHQPHYNILLKDSKSYPFIKITTTEAFPRVEITRDIKKDGNQYYGPYTNVIYMKKLLEHLEWFFPHRSCSRTICETKNLYARACLNLQMGKCPGPCMGKITRADYMKNIHKIVKHLLGKSDDLLKDMKREMQELSDDLQYEKAAQLRDKILRLTAIYKKSKVYFEDFQDRDVIACYREDNQIAVAVLKLKSGKISGKEVYSFKNITSDSTESVLRAFLLQYYLSQDDIVIKTENLPHQILLQIEPEDFCALNTLFYKKLVVPQRGEYVRLIEMARKNAFDFVESIKLSHLKKASRSIVSIQEIKNHLNLRHLPRKMVCIDISTIQGSETVSSLVFFENGKPVKKHYRHFIIQTVDGQDDYASIAETMDRYLKNLVRENGWVSPDLIIIDGGKGQLSSAMSILQTYQEANETLRSIEIISLAKRIEEVFVPILTNNARPRYESIIIPKTSPALKVMTHIRDEAHRFAITHHRKRRDARTLSSALDSVKGLGEEKKFLLLKHFGSVENIQKANLVELLKVNGIGEKLAVEIMNMPKKLT
jgi:excinuclease ABC subunit C